MSMLVLFPSIFYNLLLNERFDVLNCAKDWFHLFSERALPVGGIASLKNYG